MVGGPHVLLSAALASASALPHVAMAAAATEAQPQESGGVSSGRDIVVLGRREGGVIVGLPSENELNEADIAAYGLDTVEDLLGEIADNLGASRDEPVVLVNGEPANGIGDIARLPTEALSRVQVLPRSLAARYGAPPGRKVINLVLKPTFRQRRISADTGFATAGGGGTFGGELGYARIAKGNRTNVSMRFRDADPLLESQRRILTASADQGHFDFAGNVVAHPLPGTEIDPVLSALAGTLVTAVAVPVGKTNPLLADFAAAAGRTNVSDLGPFRTLVPRSRVYGINVSLVRKLSQKTNLAVNLRGDLSRTASRTGVVERVFVLPAGSPFSPFSTDVGIARLVGVPLTQDRESRNFFGGATLNTRLGLWRLSASGNYSRSESDTDTDRDRDLGELQRRIAAGLVNPFDALPAELVGPAVRDVARAHRDRATAQVVLDGSLVRLPAGAVTMRSRHIPHRRADQLRG
jgi:iron complex outermembrane recepter protein